MTVEELMQMISLFSFILAGVFLLISIALFFLFDIHRVIGDISGATARKAIENIRQQNEETGDKAYKPSKVNMERGKVTDKISPSGRIHKQSDPLTVATGTSKLDNMYYDPTTVLEVTSETTVLNNGSETTVLNDGVETTVLNNMYETEMIENQSFGGETTVLSQSTQNVFAIDYELGFCGSAEIIE